MSAIRQELVNAAYQKAHALTDYIIDDEGHESRQKLILADKSLTKDERSEAIKVLNENYDYYKILSNKGKRRLCNNCNQECLATLYCEYCVRNYLKSKFSNWTSGNNDVDSLIQKCQMEAHSPDYILEWISYDKLTNIKYLTRGGSSDIYLAEWIEGGYDRWDENSLELKRFGSEHVILKRLENVKLANKSWFEEAKSHLTLGNKKTVVVKCNGFTQEPSTKEYFLVMNQMDIDLRRYLLQNHHLSWKERIQITFYIIDALNSIHKDDIIHKDLHSGNILYLQHNNYWYISDLGFCGPADMPAGSIYGNLPYIAPEVIAGKGYTKASDIYSVGMLMWEIASGQPPFNDFEDDYDLATKIINGLRPKIVSNIPLEYKKLMEECWGADPSNRPDIGVLHSKINEINKLYDQKLNGNKNIIKKFLKNFQPSQPKSDDGLETNETCNIEIILKGCRTFISKVYKFEHFPDPKNAIEEMDDQEVENCSNSSAKNNSAKSGSIFEGNNKSSKRLSKVFKKLRLNHSSSDIHNSEVQQQPKGHSSDDDDTPNLHLNETNHLEVRNRLEVPDVNFLKHMSI